jgi:hypothetical protein
MTPITVEVEAVAMRALPYESVAVGERRVTVND